MGKLLTSHRYNHLSLLHSCPGEVHGSWSYKTYPGANIGQRMAWLQISVEFGVEILGFERATLCTL